MLDVRSADRERGAIAVEVGLTIPFLVVLILGAVHLGVALSAHHTLADATSYATRMAAMHGATMQADVSALLQDRMAKRTHACQRVDVSVSVVPGLPPYGAAKLVVESTCWLKPPFGASWLDAVAIDYVAARAAMPVFFR